MRHPYNGEDDHDELNNWPLIIGSVALLIMVLITAWSKGQL